MFYLINAKKYENKSVNQLWDEDRKTFFIWLACFLASLFAIFLIQLSVIVILGVDKDNIIARVNKYISDKKTIITGFSYWNNLLTSEIFSITLTIVAIACLISSGIKSIKSKNLASISTFPSFFMFFKVVISVIGLIFISANNIDIIEGFKFTKANIISFSLSFVYIIIWFVLSRNVSLIKRIFLRSYLLENLKQTNEGMFQNGMFQNQNNNAMAPNFEQSNQMVKEADPKFQKLNNLNKNQLDEIAKKMFISGYEMMSKEELVSTIYSIYIANEDPKEKNELKQNEGEESKEEQST